jgi:hypothetical protein
LLSPPLKHFFFNTVRLRQIRNANARFKLTHDLANLCIAQTAIAHRVAPVRTVSLAQP